MTDAVNIREKQITRASITGIIANVFLAGFKAVAGLIAGSVSVILDAVNNLTDALSSVVTIVGIKLAKKPPDKSHPFGHGRVEYLSALIIAAIVLAAGVMSLVESAKKIFDPEVPDYSTVTLVIISVAVVTKLVLGRYVKAKGVKYKSDALVAAGSDATFDAILSFSTLIGAIVALIWDISVDGYIGVLISGFIIKAGIEMLMQPLSNIVGKREDSAVTRGIAALIRTVDGVQGVYDLILHNYGPNYAIGSVHIELPDTFSAKEIHMITAEIQHLVLTEYHVFLTVGIYAIDTQDEELAEIRRVVRESALSKEGVLNTHGIFIRKNEKTINFDILVDFKVRDRAALAEEIRRDVNLAYPDYSVIINIDNDYSD